MPHPRAAIACRGNGACRWQRERTINGQPVKFKALAAFVAGPSLIWSAVAPAGSIVARAVAGTVGVLVTLIDGGHVIRHYRSRAP